MSQLLLRVPKQLLRPLKRAAKKRKLSEQQLLLVTLAESLDIQYEPRKPGRPRSK